MGDMGGNANVHKFLFAVMKYCKLRVIVAQLCKYTKNHGLSPLKNKNKYPKEFPSSVQMKPPHPLILSEF